MLGLGASARPAEQLPCNSADVSGNMPLGCAVEVEPYQALAMAGGCVTNVSVAKNHCYGKRAVLPSHFLSPRTSVTNVTNRCTLCPKQAFLWYDGSLAHTELLSNKVLINADQRRKNNSQKPKQCSATSTQHNMESNAAVKPDMSSQTQRDVNQQSCTRKSQHRKTCS